MLNFSSLSGRTGKILRLPLKLVPRGAVMPVIQGELRGMRIIAGSGTAGFWLGTYELEKQRMFARLVKPGDTVFDVGAHVGFYTLLAARLAGPSGRVVSFEPFPDNVAYLRKHVALNRLGNVTVVDAAVTDAASTAHFNIGGSTFTGSLQNTGTLTVQTIALDAPVIAGTLPSPDVIKIDVEGAEDRVLRGAARILSTKRPTVLLSTHSDEARTACRAILEKAGYRLEPLVMRGGVPSADEFLCLTKDAESY